MEIREAPFSPTPSPEILREPVVEAEPKIIASFVNLLEKNAEIQDFRNGSVGGLKLFCFVEEFMFLNLYGQY